MFCSFYTVENETEQEAVVFALVHSPENPSKLSPAVQVGEYFYKTTRQLVEDYSFTLVGGKVRGLNVVRYVLKVVPVFWVAQLVC
jgi:linoleate 10R-lipoxygenase